MLRALSDAGLRCRSVIATGGQGEEKDRAKAWRTQVGGLEGGGGGWEVWCVGGNGEWGGRFGVGVGTGVS